MEGNYDYYQLYLTAPLTKIAVKMLSSSNIEPSHYPVSVLDGNNISVGTAESKAAYISLWNASNTDIGKLTGGTGPFSFVLELKKGQSIPSKVTGDPVDIFEGIFSNSFGSEFN
ncbi:hypothetical protein [Chitinophaga sp. LS1]|uniref:hypothetical protein n=1 Tax=Chitinophaga sp. LS1 TaxID=3051176 RepID=UPI002AAB7D91|nr:hypothetical protein [Chitinophaga sp. LS1]WPV66274.1 hypothetical protein QQL36_31240 [Chitinophaga sp. LS1]